MRDKVKAAVEIGADLTKENILNASIKTQLKLVKAINSQPSKVSTNQLVQMVYSLVSMAKNSEPDAPVVQQVEQLSNILNGVRSFPGAFTKAEQISIPDKRTELYRAGHNSTIYQVEREGKKHTMIIQYSSYSLARNRQYAESDHKTTQEENFENSRYEGGKLKFVSQESAYIVCDEAVSLAKKAGIKLMRTKDEDDQTRGARVKKEAVKAGLGYYVAKLLDILIAGAIRVDEEGDANTIVILRSGYLELKHLSDTARRTGCAGADLAALDEVVS